MKAGDRVRYKRPMDNEEKDLVFTVAEVNGDRCLINIDMPGWTLKPCFLRRTAELITLEEGTR